MDDLVQFLRDRYDDEAAEARAAEKRTTTTRRMIQGQWVEDTVQPPEWRRSAWPPARVLAEIDAKREVLRLASAARDYHETFMSGFAAEMEKALRLYAVPYADHPGYRDAWRP